MHIFHSYRLRDAQPMRSCLNGNLVKDVTELLYVCDCGKVKTKCIDGHWDLYSMLPDAREVVEDFIERENASVPGSKEV